MVDAGVLIATEGLIDVAVAEKMLMVVGLRKIVATDARGKHGVLDRLRGMNESARNQACPCFVLCDWDGDENCVPLAHRKYMRGAQPAPYMVFRIAVHAIESWILADRNAFAKFLKIREHDINLQPDTYTHPKMEVVKLARRSREHDITEALVPTNDSGAQQGAEYNDYIGRFVREKWNPQRAAKNSESLKKALIRLRELRKRLEQAAP